MDPEQRVPEPVLARKKREAVQMWVETLHTSDIVLNPMMSWLVSAHHGAMQSLMTRDYTIVTQSASAAAVAVGLAVAVIQEQGKSVWLILPALYRLSVVS